MSGTPPGVFGKLPARGDFLAHGLPPAFTGPLHEWLARSLPAARQTMGAGFTEAWLQAPVWRFAFQPGVCGPLAASGVLMPSVDAAGRDFPLCLARTAEGPLDLLALLAMEAWFARLEEQARLVLEDGFALLPWLAGLATAEGALPAGGAPQHWQSLAGPALADDLAALLARSSGAALALFWGEGSPLVRPCALLGPGLPEGAAFCRLLSDAEAR